MWPLSLYTPPQQCVSGRPTRPLWFLVDLSPVMVGLVIDRIKARGLDDRITAQQADAQDLSGFHVRKPSGPCTMYLLPHATPPMWARIALGAQAGRSVPIGNKV